MTTPPLPESEATAVPPPPPPSSSSSATTTKGKKKASSSTSNTLTDPASNGGGGKGEGGSSSGKSTTTKQPQPLRKLSAASQVFVPSSGPPGPSSLPSLSQGGGGRHIHDRGGPGHQHHNHQHQPQPHHDYHHQQHNQQHQYPAHQQPRGGYQQQPPPYYQQQQQQQQYYPSPHHPQHHQQQPYPPMMNGGPGGGPVPHPHGHAHTHTQPLPPPHQQQHQQIDPALEEAILLQVEHYFSLDNLKTDKYMSKKMRGGTLSFECLVAFPRVKALTTDRHLIARIVAQRSTLVVLTQNGKRIGRRDHVGVGDLGLRVVEITHLSAETTTEETVRALVCAYGEIANVEIGWEDEEEGNEGEGGGGGGGGGKKGRGGGHHKNPHLHRRAFVEFVDAKGAILCVDALSGGTGNWRRGYRVAFLNGSTVVQAVRQLGLEKDEELAGLSIYKSGEGGGGSGGDTHTGTGSSSSSAAGIYTSTPASNGNSNSSKPSLADAKLPPVLSEGEHIGCVTELDNPPPPSTPQSSTQEQPHLHTQTQPKNKPRTGVLKREGKRRCSISFTLPEGMHLSIGDRVTFSVKHIDNKAVVINVAPAPPSPQNGHAQTHTHTHTTTTTSTTTQPKSRPPAKGPDATIGFRLPRAKPPVELNEVIEALKKLEVAIAEGGGGKKK